MVTPTPTSTNRLVDGLVARLQTALPARLERLRLPAVTAVLDYPPTHPNPAQAPQVWVDLVRERAEGPGEMGVCGGLSTRTQTLLVGVTCAGEHGSEANRRLRSYVDMIREVVVSERQIPGVAFNLRWLRTDYSGNLAPAGLALFREAVLTVEADRWVRDGQD